MNGHSPSLRLAALALALALALAPRAAQAFCRTSSCTDCERDPVTGCTLGGAPVAWPEVCLGFSVSQDASAGLDLDQARALMAEAFATWEGARCGSDAAPPSIRVSHAFGAAGCAEPEHDPDAGDASLIVFRQDAWEHTSPDDELAMTTLTVDDHGVIYGASVEINATGPRPMPLANDAQALGLGHGQHDLLSIMVHEAGHFLGLDHSRAAGAVMQAELSPSQLRNQLSADDVAAICAVYPPERAARACAPEPHSGPASACLATPLAGSCSVQQRTPSAGAPLALLSGLGSLVYLRLERRRRAR